MASQFFKEALSALDYTDTIGGWCIQVGPGAFWATDDITVATNLVMPFVGEDAGLAAQVVVHEETVIIDEPMILDRSVARRLAGLEIPEDTSEDEE